MRFQFTRPSGIGLPVIPVVSNHKLSTIEGRNGIGKTLAARILEFLTGSQPFTALPKAWDSFCEDLGRLTVIIDGFPTAEVVRCELDSSKWKGRKESDCVANPGDAFINNRAADWNAVRRLISVRRIAGDEGLSETLARTLREASVYARGRDADTAALVDRFADELGELTDDLVAVRTQGYAEEAEWYRKASQQLQAKQADAERTAQKYERFAVALAHHRTILGSLHDLPQFLTDYGHALEAHQRAEQSVKAADQTLTDFGRQEVVSAENASRIDWLVDRLPHRMRHLANARVQEQSAHSLLNLEERLSTSEIRVRAREIDARILSLEEENKSGYLAGTVRGAQNTIEGELRAMPKAAQQERFAIVGRDIRVHELADGIAIRRKQLEGVPKPDEVAERERTVSRLRNQRSWLDYLNDVYKKTDQKQSLVDEGTFELIALRGASDEGQVLTDANEKAAAARTDLLTASIAVRACQAAIDAATGLQVVVPGPEPEGNIGDEDNDDGDAEDDELPVPFTVEEVAARIAEWMSRVGVTLDEPLRDAWEKAVGGSGASAIRIGNGHELVANMVETLAVEARAAEEARAATAAEVTDLTLTQERAEEIISVRLQRLGIALRSLHDADGPWSPYRAAVDAVLSGLGLDPAIFNELAVNGPRLSDLLDGNDPRGTAILTAIRAVETVAEISGEVESSAARVRDQWFNTGNYLYRFSGDLSPRLDDSPFDTQSMRASAGTVLTKWAERTISDLLSSPELRAELFDNSHSVTFNISDLTVSWTEQATRRKRRRPIEAFSSGEQVFAYTRAKLERLRGLRQEAQYVVVFLDEFGAFVARDRFAQLVTYIEHDALGEIADQIVVTVPLSAELEQVRDNAALANVEAELIDPPGYVVIPARTE